MVFFEPSQCGQLDKPRLPKVWLELRRMSKELGCPDLCVEFFFDPNHYLRQHHCTDHDLKEWSTFVEEDHLFLTLWDQCRIAIVEYFQSKKPTVNITLLCLRRCLVAFDEESRVSVVVMIPESNADDDWRQVRNDIDIIIASAGIASAGIIVRVLRGALYRDGDHWPVEIEDGCVPFIRDIKQDYQRAAGIGIGSANSLGGTPGTMAGLLELEFRDKTIKRFGLTNYHTAMPKIPNKSTTTRGAPDLLCLSLKGLRNHFERYGMPPEDETASFLRAENTPVSSVLSMCMPPRSEHEGRLALWTRMQTRYIALIQDLKRTGFPTFMEKIQLKSIQRYKDETDEAILIASGPSNIHLGTVYATSGDRGGLPIRMEDARR